MATINSVIIDARYDIRDTQSTLCTDTELLIYANRGLFQLDNVLSAMGSDWVLTEQDVTIDSGNNYATAPTGAIVIREAWISSTEIIKISPKAVYRKRRSINSTGQPKYFAEKGTQSIFEQTTDQEYTAKTYFDKRATVLVTDASMPYSDEFNSAVREMIVLLANKRNEKDFYSDTVIYNFFFEKLAGNVVRRNHVPARRKLDF